MELSAEPLTAPMAITVIFLTMIILVSIIYLCASPEEDDED